MKKKVDKVNLNENTNNDTFLSINSKMFLKINIWRQ